jgi:hypothetical protein
MEMNTGSVLLQQVVDSNNYSVTPTSCDGWTRHLSIDEKPKSFDTVRRDSGVSDIEGVRHDLAGYGCILIVVCIDIEAAKRLGVATGLSFARRAVG